MVSGRSISYQRIFPLSTLVKRPSSPHPRLTHTVSGYFFIHAFISRSNRIVLETTPSWLINLSYFEVSSPSDLTISTALVSQILAFSLNVSFALIARGINIVSCTSPNCSSIFSLLSFMNPVSVFAGAIPGTR